MPVPRPDSQCQHWELLNEFYEFYFRIIPYYIDGALILKHHRNPIEGEYESVEQISMLLQANQSFGL